MRIAISGSSCQGKTTVVNDMLRFWPQYKRSEESYRMLIKNENLQINKKVNKDGQWKILNCLVDDILKTSKTDKIIFDRCPLDNLVYSLWAETKGTSDIDREFIEKCIPLVKESMRSIDVIFFLPITRVAPVQIEYKESREIDAEYIQEIDNIFKAIEYSLMHKGACPFLVDDDRPPIIEIFGTPEQRIEMVKLYLNNDGEAIEEQSILSPENVSQMEVLLKAQQKAYKEEEKEVELREEIINKK